MRALDKVPVISEKRVDAMLKNLTLVADKVSQMGYQQLMIMKSASKLNDNILNITANIQEVTSSSTNVNKSQESLNNEILKITHVSEEINSVMNLIKNIANHTKLLGLNASIEAARAGQAGLGFSIVAKEIQKLSNESNNAVNKIKVFTSQINDNVIHTLEISNRTLEISNDQEKAMKVIVNLIEDISNLADQLNKMANNVENRLLVDQGLRDMY